MKNINYKLINLLMVVIIILLIWLMKDLWLGILGKVSSIILPFIVGFAIAYVLYPLLKWMQQKGIPKQFALLILCIILVIFVTFILWLIIPNILPMVFEQTTSFFAALIKFVQDISSKYDVNLVGIKDSIAGIAVDITSSLGKTISNGFITVITESISIISKAIIIFIATVYFLSDMENIRHGFEKFLKSHKEKKTFRFVRTLDNAVHQYVNAFALYALIIFIEYTTVFYLIGHPYFLLLGLLSAIGTLIPYFGGIITNIIAVVTASVISSNLLILTIIVAIIFPNIDGYFTAPKIYNNSNQVPALLSIFAVFAGGIIYGPVGIIIALPITIILLTTYRFYRDDISDSFAKMKEKSND